MNIIQAFEANKTQKVKSPLGTIWDIGKMDERMGRDWPSVNVFGEWTVVREPRRVWVNVYRGVLSGSVFESLDTR